MVGQIVCSKAGRDKGKLMALVDETEQGMLHVKGKDLHVNRLSLEKGEVDLTGHIDSVAYSEVQQSSKKGDNFFMKLFK